MGHADHFVLGDYNAACFECGRKFKASGLKKHWKGYYVCPEHWEPRQPQDFIGPVPQTDAPKWAQLQGDYFVPSGVPDNPPYDPTNPNWPDPPP